MKIPLENDNVETLHPNLSSLTPTFDRRQK